MRVVIISALAFCVPSAWAQPLGVNLVDSGGGETGDTGGWVNNGFEVDPVVPSTAGFGEFVFTAGQGPASGESLTQDIDVAGRAEEIDGPGLDVQFSLYIQSRRAGGVNDVGSASVTFLNGVGSALDSNAFTDPDVPSGTWDQYGVDRPVPAGTRSIRIVLTATRGGGISTDAFFDDVMLTLGSGCSPADLAAPFGVLDIDDVLFFLSAFASGDLAADVSVPFGTLDIDDVLVFLGTFAAGCP